MLRPSLGHKADFEHDPFTTGVIKTLKSRAYYTLRKKSNILVEQSASNINDMKLFVFIIFKLDFIQIYYLFL